MSSSKLTPSYCTLSTSSAMTRKSEERSDPGRTFDGKRRCSVRPGGADSLPESKRVVPVTADVREQGGSGAAWLVAEFTTAPVRIKLADRLSALMHLARIYGLLPLPSGARVRAEAARPSEDPGTVRICQPDNGRGDDLVPMALRRAVLTSCAMKAKIVASDEREEGDRALLNFGHTFGHALETETGFSARLLHGEAVALGMVLAFDFAARLGLVAAETASRVRRHLDAIGLPTRLSAVGLADLSPDHLLSHMSKDKKVRDGRITLIMPRRIGEVFVMKDAPVDALRDFLSAVD